MNRLLSQGMLPFCLAALSLPALLSACSSKEAGTTAPDTTAPDTTTGVTTTGVTTTVASPVADTNSAPAATTTVAPVAAATTPVTPKAGATTAGASAPAGKSSGYKVAHEVPQGLTEAQMKTVWVPVPPSNFAVGAHPRVKLVTSKGEIVVALDPKAAPLHTRSFVYLAKRGFFNNTIFHRWADLDGMGGTIIQGGDPLSRSAATRDYAGQGGPGYTIPREHNNLTHQALVIAAARTQDPDSAGSQFYITQAPTEFLDTTGGGYTVFGRVVQGGDVAKKLRQDDKILRAQVLK